MFKHFIFCRYNVGLYTDNPYKIENTDKWMEERLPKYKRLLESLKEQTVKNFVFVLFIDENTPDKYLNQLIDLTIQPFPVSIVKHSGGDLLNVGKDYLARYEMKEKWVITSRVDNDDAYLPLFVESIQAAFSEKEQLLDVRGYQIDEKTGTKYATGRNKCNSPFISIIEEKEGAKTVFNGFHADMFLSYSSRMASEKPMYIQYIHDSNVSNTISGIKYD